MAKLDEFLTIKEAAEFLGVSPNCKGRTESVAAGGRKT